jgi:hypothetical protein
MCLRVSRDTNLYPPGHRVPERSISLDANIVVPSPSKAELFLELCEDITATSLLRGHVNELSLNLFHPEKASHRSIEGL